MKKYLIRFCYDGHPFHGWQVQKDTMTVQYEMEKALNKILKSKTSLTASGRTDAGVHAVNQFAHFSAETRMEPSNITAALNSNVTKAIFIKECSVVNDDFHARFSAKKRIYIYKIMKTYSPFERYYAAFIPQQNISLNPLQIASKYLLGTHNFNVFAQDTSQLSSTNCTVEKADWNETPTHYIFTICANRFMHNMVRRIVGTLTHICHNGLEVDYIKKIITIQDYSLLGTTAPPQGLYLYDVIY